jgi:hypothetical protein
MKTHQQIQVEANQVAILGQQFRADQVAGGASLALVAQSPALARFPVASVDGAVAVPMPQDERFVDAALERNELLYRLVEREPDAGSLGTAAAGGSLAVIAVSDSPFDVLRTGYELAEEERLAEQLAPYDERDEGSDRDETTAALESILESELLPLADRLRTKAEIGAFLDGELEAGDLIARTIARQCAREGPSEAQHMRHELRLTIDEP